MRIKIQVLPTDNVAQWVEHRRDIPKDLGSNPSERHIVNFFRCVLSFSATLSTRWKVQFRLGLAKNSTMLNQITAYKYQKITMLEKYNQLWTFVGKILLTKKNVDQKTTRWKESGGVNWRCRSE